MSPEPLTFRAPMRHRSVADRAAVARALSRGVVGLDGVLPAGPADLRAGLAEVSELHGDRLAARIERFTGVPDDSFVWTRDEDGETYLGRLTGAWLYDDSPAAAAVHLVHVRPCIWLPDPIEPRKIPAAVSATFARGGLNWQRIRAAGTGGASQRLWDQHTDK